MMDPQKLENITPENIGKYVQQSARGDRAHVLVNDPLLRSAWESVKKDLLLLLLNSNPGSSDATKWHYMHQALGAVEREIESYIGGGKEASAILAAKEEMEADLEAKNKASTRTWVE